MIRKLIITILTIFALVGTASAAVQIDNMTMQAGINAVKETPIYEPLTQIIMIGLGILFFMGVAAFIRCGGATLFGYTIGRPDTAAKGFLGMVGVIGSVIVFLTGLAFYVWYVD